LEEIMRKVIKYFIIGVVIGVLLTGLLIWVLESRAGATVGDAQWESVNNPCCYTWTEGSISTAMCRVTHPCKSDNDGLDVFSSNGFWYFTVYEGNNTFPTIYTIITPKPQPCCPKTEWILHPRNCSINAPCITTNPNYFLVFHQNNWFLQEVVGGVTFWHIIKVAK
jgi:hypothetical protein